MSPRSLRPWILSLLVLVGLATGRAWGQNEGQEDLDRATEAKLTARTLTDYGKVIQLLESALEKGLDEGNEAFAKQLLSSTRIERGTRIAGAIFGSVPPDRNWPEFRRLALEDLEKGIEMDPQQPHALFTVARLNLLPGGDADRARGALDEAIRLSEDDAELRGKALALRASLHKEVEKQLADLDEAIRTDPGFAAAYRARAAIHTKEEDYEKAVDDIKAALKIEPDHAPTHEQLAEVLVEMERYEEALKSLGRVRELVPKSAIPLFQMGRIRVLQSEFEKALEILSEGHELDPGNVGVLLLRASVHQQLDDNEKALADVERALELKPELAVAKRFRAMLLAESGKLDLAIEDLEELQRAEPENLEDTLRLAMFYSANKKPRQAIEKFSEVLKLQPDDEILVIVLRGRADAYLGVGKHAEAIDDYEKAIKLDPEDSGILNNLAWVLCTSPFDELRDGKRAIKLATKACELTEYKAAHILSTLGAAYAETGDIETAKKWSRKAIELGEEDQLEALKKELETYEKGEKVRELMTAPEPDEEDANEESKNKEKKPERTHPDELIVPDV